MMTALVTWATTTSAVTSATPSLASSIASDTKADTCSGVSAVSGDFDVRETSAKVATNTGMTLATSAGCRRSRNASSATSERCSLSVLPVASMVAWVATLALTAASRTASRTGRSRATDKDLRTADWSLPDRVSSSTSLMAITT